MQAFKPTSGYDRHASARLRTHSERTHQPAARSYSRIGSWKVLPLWTLATSPARSIRCSKGPCPLFPLPLAPPVDSVAVLAMNADGDDDPPTPKGKAPFKSKLKAMFDEFDDDGGGSVSRSTKPHTSAPYLFRRALGTPSSLALTPAETTCCRSILRSCNRS